MTLEKMITKYDLILINNLDIFTLFVDLFYDIGHNKSIDNYNIIFNDMIGQVINMSSNLNISRSISIFSGLRSLWQTPLL
jgi:hypothetical protein